MRPLVCVSVCIFYLTLTVSPGCVSLRNISDPCSEYGCCGDVCKRKIRIYFQEKVQVDGINSTRNLDTRE